MAFNFRKFSMNRNTGVPRPARRFSNAEPTANEASSKIHRQFRAAHEGHLPHAGLDATRASTGVVWCTERAAEFGFLDEPDQWANLGQGAPEVEDSIEGCFQRPKTLDISVNSREYGPTAGIKPLREAVANLYNEMHRQGKPSKYTWENVAIVPGGRAGLIRIAAVLNNAYVGFFIPDYTAYNEMLSLFKNFAAIPVPLSKEDNYHINPEKIAAEIERGTGVILTSNPRNPTGRVVAGAELAEIQDICRDRATFISDEFYSGYNYTSDCDGTTISAAENVEDVDEDDVLIIDGLTKRFRLPGWRVAWIIGPKEFIKAIGSCGSYLDGGTNVPFQEAAIPMLEPKLVREEMKALQHHFRDKRDYVVKRLREMGFNIKHTPDSTFYLWLDLEGLPEPIADGLNFFQACLEEKVIVVPGIFFDLNPSRRRDLFDSPCHHFVRFSYGPKMETLKLGCDGIERVLKKFKSHQQLKAGDTPTALKKTPPVVLITALYLSPFMRRAAPAPAAAAHQLTRTLYAPRPSPSARILSSSSSSSSSFSSNAGRNHSRPAHQHQHPQSLHPALALALGQRAMATSSQQQQQQPATTTPPGPERQREGDKEQKKPALLLEDSSAAAAAAAEDTHKIDLSDGGQGSVKLDSLGPLVVHKDGTTSRISNWGEMTRIERENTLRVLGKRNQLRLGQLRGQAGGNGNADGGNAS